MNSAFSKISAPPVSSQHKPPRLIQSKCYVIRGNGHHRAHQISRLKKAENNHGSRLPVERGPCEFRAHILYMKIILEWHDKSTG